MARVFDLRERDIEVLRLVAEGLTYEEVAGHLGHPFVTVKGWMHRAMAILGAANKTHAIALMYEQDPHWRRRDR